MKDPQYGKGVLLLHCNERVIGRIKDSKIKIPALIYNAGFNDTLKTKLSPMDPRSSEADHGTSIKAIELAKSLT